MNSEYCTDKMVAELAATMLGSHCTMREKHVFTEALRSLVRLAKSEQMLEMKNNVRRMTGAVIESAGRSRGKCSGSDRQLSGTVQQQFEFMKIYR